MTSGLDTAIAVALLALAASMLGALALRRVARLPVDTDALADRLDALLPQTQCGRCTYAGCRPYALALRLSCSCGLYEDRLRGL